MLKFKALRKIFLDFIQEREKNTLFVLRLKFHVTKVMNNDYSM